MTKRYRIWVEPKDGSENGKWDIACGTTKERSEELVRLWNISYPELKHEVRERP